MYAKELEPNLGVSVSQKDFQRLLGCVGYQQWKGEHYT